MRLIRRRTTEERTGTMTVIEHLQELRHRLIVSLVAVALGSVVGWFLYEPMKDLLRGPYCDYVRSLPIAQRPPSGCRLVFQAPTDAFLVKLKIVVFLGLLAALPVVLYQLWAFIMPGLTAKEKRWSIPFIVSSTALFATGGFLAYFTLDRAFDFLLGFAGEGVVPLITFDRYMGFVVLVTLAFGLSFLFPILLIALQGARVLSTARLRRWRRYAILGIAVFAAVITPSGDPYTMLAMMIPMYLFYEGAIIIGRLMKR
jgi:sec-independent protein translocase protein TatC